MHSLKTGSPFIFINRFGRRARQEGMIPSRYGKVFYTNVMLSGAVPQISLICGPCAGRRGVQPGADDFIIQTRQAADVYYRGRAVIKSVDRRDVTADQLGGRGDATWPSRA